MDAFAHQIMARDILDCRFDPAWSRFLDALQANSFQGFPVDEDLVRQASNLLVRDELLFNMAYKHSRHQASCPAWNTLVGDMCSWRRPAALPVEGNRSCYYGHLSARWVVARHYSFTESGPGGWNASHFFESQRHALHIFTRQQSYSDWMEESSWPVLLLDMLASAGRCLSHQNPHDRRRAACRRTRGLQWKLLPESDLVDPRDVPKSGLHRWSMPKGWHKQATWDLRVQAGGGAEPRRLLGPRGASKLVSVWELGIHMTLSAEILTVLGRALRASGGTLRARSLITHQYPNFQDRCQLYWNARMECIEQQDEASVAAEAAVMKKLPWSRADGTKTTGEYYEAVRWTTWEQLGAALAAAIERTAAVVDLIVVTHPIAFLIALKTNPRLRRIPTLAYVATLVQYMLSKRDVPRFRELLVEESGREGNMFVAQFAWAAKYIPATDSGDPSVQGGLSLYTGLHPQPRPVRGLLVINRDHPRDDLLACLLRRKAAEAGVGGSMPPHRIAFVHELAALSRNSWQEYTFFHAVAIFPYCSFTLTFEELYNLGVPIFIPRHFSKHVYDPPLYVKSPAQYTSTFVRLASFEYFHRPLVMQFDSLADLLWKAGPQRAHVVREVRSTQANRVRDVRRARLAFWRRALSS